jgi:serine/threonine protein kinase
MISCRTQVYKLAQDLHSIGIVHGDLEPRNVMRILGGGFYVIDFSQSRKHICKENMVQYMVACSFMVADIEIGRPTVHSSLRCSSKRYLFRITDITKLIVETAPPPPTSSGKFAY